MARRQGPRYFAAISLGGRYRAWQPRRGDQRLHYRYAGLGSGPETAGAHDVINSRAWRAASPTAWQSESGQRIPAACCSERSFSEGAAMTINAIPNSELTSHSLRRSTERLPHGVIVRAPGLLPMRYKTRELAEELSISTRTIRRWARRGMPHQRDSRDHIWVHGEEFAVWVEDQRCARRGPKLDPDEGSVYAVVRQSDWSLQ
jgi:hypothetical protein